MFRIVLIASIVFATSISFCQEIKIVQTEFYNNEIIIHYELNDTQQGNLYLVSVFSSHDQFSNPLKFVVGDVGGEISPGVNKKIVWKINKELENINSRIVIELRGVLSIPIAKFTNIKKEMTWRRGRHHILTWHAGNNHLLNLQLLSNGKKVWEEKSVANSGIHHFKLPIKIPKGKNYSIRLVDSKNENVYSTSKEFKIKAKHSLAFKSLLFVSASLVYFLLNNSGNSTDDVNNQKPKEIPNPVLPN